MRGAWAAAVLLLAGCAPHEGNAPAGYPGTLAAKRRVWAAIQPLAASRGIDPGFVYAVVRIESNFNAHERRGEACGLMQIKPSAWKDLSRVPFGVGVWNWRMNLEVGIESLASIKGVLARKGVFSYPLLWASYHYGLDYVEARGFDTSRIPRPSDPISYRLFKGEIHPLAPPN